MAHYLHLENILIWVFLDNLTAAELWHLNEPWLDFKLKLNAFKETEKNIKLTVRKTVIGH